MRRLRRPVESGTNPKAVGNLSLGMGSIQVRRTEPLPSRAPGGMISWDLPSALTAVPPVVALISVTLLSRGFMFRLTLPMPETPTCSTRGSPTRPRRASNAASMPRRPTAPW